MAAPIPVFSFVFAAYAATAGAAGRSADVCRLAPLNPRGPFRTAWRTQFARGGAVFAKIGWIKGSSLIENHWAVGSSGEASEDFWVGGIVESKLGYSGAPLGTQLLPSKLIAGQQVHFHVINVLDWRIGACPSSAVSRPDADALNPSLSDTTGS